MFRSNRTTQTTEAEELSQGYRVGLAQGEDRARNDDKDRGRDEDKDEGWGIGVLSMYSSKMNKLLCKEQMKGIRMVGGPVLSYTQCLLTH
jgi:hypothetical protein